MDPFTGNDDARVPQRGSKRFLGALSTFISDFAWSSIGFLVGGAIAGVIALMAHYVYLGDDYGEFLPRAESKYGFEGLTRVVVAGGFGGGGGAMFLLPVAWMGLIGTNVRLGLFRCCAAGWMVAPSAAVLFTDAIWVVAAAVTLVAICHRVLEWRAQRVRRTLFPGIPISQR
ncbi:MAG: hypothetical protein AAFZ65_17800 [Planctomycetota bacterium]